MMTIRSFTLCFTFLLLVSSVATAGLVLNPQRIVVLDKERTASLELLNNSDETARFQIYFEHKKMLEDGSIVDLDDNELNDGRILAGDMIRYSPRRVDIESQGSQTIRLAVRRPKDLPEGEYVSHLVLKQIPEKVASDANNKENAGGNDKALSFKVQPILKIAIPVIVRKGELQASASVSDISVIQADIEHPAIQLKLHRSGNRSLYGDIEIFKLEGNSVGTRVGFAKGIALYDPTQSRLVNVQIDKGIAKPGVQLLVRFDEKGKYGGDNLVEQIITVSP